MAEGIFSGLESMGFSGLGNLDIFGGKTEKGSGDKKEEKKPELSEKDFLFNKTTVCPCCENTFKVPTVKNSAARLLGTDIDLRPKHAYVDVNKYDAIICPKCGYSALTRYFTTVFSSQKKLISAGISANFQERKQINDSYTYDEAIEICKMSLLNAVIKDAKASEKAYICLKTAWLYRGKAESLEGNDQEYLKAKENEAEFLKNAYEGFTNAVANEFFPICGMDEMTVDYLIAALAYLTDHPETSARLISKILLSQSASVRIKDKTRTLKEEVVKKLHANNS